MTATFHVVAILLAVVVLPLWLSLHYATRWRQTRVMTADSERSLGELGEVAARLERRMDNLERLLDAIAPETRREK